MKKNLKIVIFISILVIVVGILVVFKNSHNKDNFYVEDGDYIYSRDLSKIYTKDGSIDPLNYLEKEEKFVVNKKAKDLVEQKNFLDYSFSEFKAVDGEEKNRIVLEVKNITGDKVPCRAIQVILLNQDEDVVDTIYMVIPEMEKDAVLYLNAMSSVKMEEVFNYVIEEASLEGVTFSGENESSGSVDDSIDSETDS